ncbi:hypothetical protein M011DRAFT_483911 [Sporormia fimetaria CBS 119925]|uniref:F-box domain-containing protein n=1 Tax=Sporormia fimetaria CBS 119925 TaxID=1340428 RepID=A0A6A6VK89_9PLEO|nr:hypothetical protein M011DRAFT_483911 [Sporormia fimetaria CBS 119925]
MGVYAALYPTTSNHKRSSKASTKAIRHTQGATEKINMLAKLPANKSLGWTPVNRHPGCGSVKHLGYRVTKPQVTERDVKAILHGYMKHCEAVPPVEAAVERCTKEEDTEIPQQLAQSLNITENNTRESPLLRLPPALRQKIFGYVLRGKTYSVCQPRNRPICIIEGSPKSKNLQLLSVGKQIHDEASMLPFKSNVFYAWPHLIASWLDSLTDMQKAAIGALRMNYPEARSGRSACYLGALSGLRHVYVTYTPENAASTERNHIVKKLRDSVGNSDLKAVFCRLE